MLEDYVALLVPDGDALWPRAQRCVDEIPEADRRFVADHRPKALIHT
jgi:hypothetical protein